MREITMWTAQKHAKHKKNDGYHGQGAKNAPEVAKSCSVKTDI